MSRRTQSQDTTPEPAQVAPRLPGRIPCLDGLRAVSITCVLLGHLVETRNFPSILNPLGHFGNLGVRCFFIISGFLITTLLLKELDRTHAVSLRAFYIRRALRIFPAGFTFIGIMYLAYRLGWIGLAPGDLLHALTYTMNYHHVRSWYLNHLWSLSVEEQFYFLWPGVLCLLGVRRALHAAVMVVVAAPFIRAWMWYGLHVSPSAMTREFQAVADILATGCLLAGYHTMLGKQPVYMRLLSSRFFFLIPLASLAIAAVLARGDSSAFYIYGQSLANLGIVLTMDWFLRFPNSPAGRLLNTAPFVWVGILSYSLYLWQEPFLNSDSAAWLAAFPMNVTLTFLAALISYGFVERPFLKLKPRNPGTI